MSHWSVRSTLLGVSLIGVAVGASLAMAGDTELMLTGLHSNVAQKAKMSGNNLMLLGQNGKWAPAPDCAYTAADGAKIIVVNGAIRGTTSKDPGVKAMQKNVPPPKEGAGTTSPSQLRDALQGTSR